MGKKAREICDVSLKELLKDLNSAYCDEWLAHYLYWYMATVVTGKMYKPVSEALKGLAADEKEHAGELAGLIITLGGVPTANINELEKNANAPFIVPPKNAADINRMIHIVLAAEAGAIEVYNKIVKKVFGKDHNTCQLITHILSEEIAHEESFENFLEQR